MKNSFNIELLIKKILNQTSEEENDLIDLWLNESKNNIKYYNQLKAAWKEQVLNKEIKLSEKEIESSWHAVKSQMIRTKNKKRILTKIRKHTDFNNKWFFKVAAVFLIGFMLVYIFGVLVDPINENYLTVQTLENEKKEIVLADGTKIWLNGNTILNYPEKFDKDKRQVKLTGEAYFEVHRDISKPFIIYSNKIDIEVLGTSFNVNDKNLSSNSIVTVASGKVAVIDKLKNLKKIELKKGEVGVYDKVVNNIDKKENLDLNYLTWKTGIFNFRNNSLVEVLNDLSHYYKVKFEITDKSKFQNIKFNSVFDNQNLDEILEVINISLGVKFEKTKDNIFLVK